MTGQDHSTQTARPSLAPLPPASVGPAVPYGGFLRQEIGEGLHMVTDGSFQMMFVVGDEEVIAVDAPQTLGAHILPAIAEVTSAPVRHVVYSHHHADHIGAATVFPADATRYAHRDAGDFLTRIPDPNRPPATTTFDTSHTVEIAGQTLVLDHLGANHSPGNLFIHAPRQQTLMLVDVIFPGWVPFASLAYSTDIPGWLTAHQQVLDYDFTTFVGGHLTRVGSRDDIAVQQEYIDDLRTEIETAYGAVDPQQVFGSVDDPSNLWAVYNAYSDAIATRAADEVVPRWTDRLGGADVYTKSHAVALAESLRIDFGLGG